MKERLQHELNYLLFLLKWISISIVAGVVSSLILTSFKYLYFQLNELFVSSDFPAPLIAILGALATGFIIYKIAPFSSGEGVPSYINGMRRENGYLSFKSTFFKYFAALFTLSTFGNGGIVGPICRVNSGIMSFVSRKAKKIGFSDEDVIIATISGFSAALGAIFLSSIGAGIFAVEILQKNKMNYRHLFPAILSSSTAVLVSRIFGWKPVFYFDTPNDILDPSYSGWMVLLAILIGFFGMGYTSFYGIISKLFNRSNKKRIAYKVLAGTAIASIVAWLINPNIMGLSEQLFIALRNGDFSHFIGNISTELPLTFIFLIILITKAVTNAITVGSGMSAGFTGPSILLGMILSLIFIDMLGIELLSVNYFSFLAVGFAGMLAANMNVPIAAAVLAVEIFGLNYSFPAAISAIIAFQINRESTVYDQTFREIVEFSKLKKEQNI